MSANVDEELRERVLLDLAKRDKTNVGDMFRGITEASATALGVERVGIWRLTADHSRMVCDDLFVLPEHRHETGDVLEAADHPAYFGAVLAGRTLRVDKASSDPRTRDLGSSSSRMDVPVWHRGTLYGVVSHDHQGPPRHWHQDESEFARNLADVAAMTLEAGERRGLEYRWASVIDGIAELILVLDRDGQVVQSNARSMSLLSRIRENASALVDRQRSLEFRDLNGYVVPHEEWPGPRALRGEQVREVYGAWHRREGFLGYYRSLTTPVYDGEEIVGSTVVLTDVTEDIQFERLKAEFLTRLGYEMKSPVAAVKRGAQDLLDEQELDPAARIKVAAIERGANRMEHVIDDVVEIHLLARGEVTLVREPVEIRALVEAQVERVKSMANGHRIHVNAPAGVELIADRARIERAVSSLLDNAVRYSPEGGDIDVTLEIDSRAVVLSVRDHGIGIPADKQPHIFEMFFRAHARTAYDYGGLGLGLYLSREIARLHGGDLWFESVEGLGSTFHLRLPREVHA